MDGSYLRFYATEGHRLHGMQLWQWLLSTANKMGIRGGSAFHAMAGFGRHHVMHEDHFFELGGSLIVEVEFIVTPDEKLKLLEIDPAFLDRSVNDGFSGGEKKRNEILQMALLEPRLALLDETDSGLDIDALRVVANGVNSLHAPDRAIVLVTHYQRLLNYIVPDFVHVMAGGRIIKTGDKGLALELESRGYDWLLESGRAVAA